jgi:hypothetical protein
MAKHRLKPQPRKTPRAWLRLAQAVGAVLALVLVAYAVAGDVGRVQDAAVPTQVDPLPVAVDLASTPVVYLEVRGA